MHNLAGVILLLLTIIAKGQDDKVNYILSLPPARVDHVDTTLLYQAKALPVPFAGHSLQQSLSYSADRIERIELVYSSFCQKQGFDQTALNRQRLIAFAKTCPALFADPSISWGLIETQSCQSPGECRENFHGFILYYRPAPDSLQTEKEIAYLRHSLENPSGYARFHGKGIIATKVKEKKGCLHKDWARHISETDRKNNKLLDQERERIYTFIENNIYCLLYTRGMFLTYVFDLRFELLSHKTEFNGMNSECAYGVWDLLKKYLQSESDMIDRIAADGGIARLHIESRVNNGKPNLTMLLNTYPCYREGKQEKTPVELYLARQECLRERDSLLPIVFQRMGWENMLLVEDLTSSMEPYTAQLLLWHQENSQRIAHYVFFNDGDGMNDKNKVIGKTGGLFNTPPLPNDELYSYITEVMRRGNGGDQPENNIEALLYARQFKGENTPLVMIADNQATPRDASLIAQLNTPVHIIICGAGQAINPAYLNLAHSTQGSLHTLNHDTHDLHKLQDGQVISIENQKFMLRGESFTRIW